MVLGCMLSLIFSRQLGQIVCCGDAPVHLLTCLTDYLLSLIDERGKGGRVVTKRLFGCWQFEDDVYVATSEPHGNIEATITRGSILPHAKL